MNISPYCPAPVDAPLFQQLLALPNTLTIEVAGTVYEYQVCLSPDRGRMALSLDFRSCHGAPPPVSEMGEPITNPLQPNQMGFFELWSKLESEAEVITAIGELWQLLRDLPDDIKPDICN